MERKYLIMIACMVVLLLIALIYLSTQGYLGISNAENIAGTPYINLNRPT